MVNVACPPAMFVITETAAPGAINTLLVATFVTSPSLATVVRLTLKNCQFVPVPRFVTLRLSWPWTGVPAALVDHGLRNIGTGWAENPIIGNRQVRNRTSRFIVIFLFRSAQPKSFQD